MKRDYFECLFRINQQDWHCLWYSNAFQGIHLDDQGMIIAFGSRDELLSYASEHSILLETSESTPIDLDAIQFWLANPTAKTINPPNVLNAWNLFGDLRSAIEQRNTDPVDVQYLRVYDKVFWANNLPSMTPEGKQYVPRWTSRDISDLSAALSPALKLFESRLPSPSKET